MLRFNEALLPALQNITTGNFRGLFPTTQLVTFMNGKGEVLLNAVITATRTKARIHNHDTQSLLQDARDLDHLQGVILPLATSDDGHLDRVLRYLRATMAMSPQRRGIHLEAVTMNSLQRRYWSDKVGDHLLQLVQTHDIVESLKRENHHVQRLSHTKLQQNIINVLRTPSQPMISLKKEQNEAQLVYKLERATERPTPENFYLDKLIQPKKECYIGQEWWTSRETHRKRDNDASKIRRGLFISHQDQSSIIPKWSPTRTGIPSMGIQNTRVRVGLTTEPVAMEEAMFRDILISCTPSSDIWAKVLS